MFFSILADASSPIKPLIFSPFISYKWVSTSTSTAQKMKFSNNFFFSNNLYSGGCFFALLVMTVGFLVRDHSFSTYAKSSEKQNFLPPDTHRCVVRNVSFLENLVYVLNEWSLVSYPSFSFFINTLKSFYSFKSGLTH